MTRGTFTCTLTDLTKDVVGMMSKNNSRGDKLSAQIITL